MVRLTAQLINMSAQKHNPVRDWELDLRGYRIPVVENLGATLDQFDTIDFTDNDIKKIDKFPLLKRLKHIMLSNNRVVRISEGLQENLPGLETLVLTNNGLKELTDLDPLATITTLKHLSLIGNPVTARKSYRLYVIYKVPSLRVLDFCRIRLKEREAATKMFKKKKSQKPQASKDNGVNAMTFTPGEKLQVTTPRPTGPTKQEAAAIKTAIMNAKSLEEYEQIQQMLQAGQIPGHVIPRHPGSKGEAMDKPEEEEEEDEEEEAEQEEEMEAEDKDEEREEGGEAAGYQDEEEDDDDDDDDMDDDI